MIVYIIKKNDINNVVAERGTENKDKINKLNIIFKDKAIKDNMCWYKHLIFCGKIFYLMTKPSFVIKNNEY